MKITVEGKKVIEGLLSSGKHNCIKVSEQTSCCGTSLVFTLTKAEPDELVNVDGVPVLLEVETPNRMEFVTIDVSDGKLTLIDEQSGGCC